MDQPTEIVKNTNIVTDTEKMKTYIETLKELYIYLTGHYPEFAKSYPYEKVLEETKKIHYPQL
jgi:hypothetical protein